MDSFEDSMENQMSVEEFLNMLMTRVEEDEEQVKSWQDLCSDFDFKTAEEVLEMFDDGGYLRDESVDTELVLLLIDRF